MKTLVLTPQALRDLEQIRSFIAADNPKRAESFLDGVEAHIRQLSESPYIGSPATEYGTGVRKLVHRPYLILHKVSADVVTILAVRHGARQSHPLA